MICYSDDNPYLKHVKYTSTRWPRLRYLAEYMDASTVPKKKQFLTFEEELERRNRVRVAVLDIAPQGHLVRSNYEDLRSLRNAMRTFKGQEDRQNARLFVVEDLSSAVIETLGFHLDVDPRFFRSHLEDHTWFNIMDEWVELPELRNSVDKRSYISVRYVQPRFYQNKESINKAKQETGHFNVLRRIDAEGTG